MCSGPNELALGLVQCVQGLANVSIILDERATVVEEAKQRMELCTGFGRLPVKHSLDTLGIHGDPFSSDHMTKELDGLLQERTLG